MQWQAPSRVTHERSEKWYIVAGILCAVAVVYGILSGAWSLSITSALLAGLFFLTRGHGREIHAIRIEETGLIFDDKMHIWAECKHFWILQADTYHELHIEMKRPFTADVVIQTADIDPYVVRDTLAGFIPQIDHKKEKILDAIIRFCKL